MFSLLLLSLLGSSASIDALTPLVIQGTDNGNQYDVGHWGPISMASDGSKAVAATNGMGATADFVWVSADGGTTFTKTSELANEVVMTRDGSKMVAVRIEHSTRTAGHKIRLSSDGGTTWSDTGAATTVKWSCLAVSSDGTKMVAAGWEGNIWLSSDTGATWTDTGVGPQEWTALAMSGDGSKIAAGTNTKIWVSTDSGSTFIEASGCPPEKWRAIAMTPDGSKFVAASQQGGVWSSPVAHSTEYIRGLPAGSEVWRGVAISDDGMTIVACNCCGGRVRISREGGTDFDYIDYQLTGYWERVAMTGDASKILVTSSQDNGRIYVGGPTTTTTTGETTTSTTTTTASQIFDGSVSLYTTATCDSTPQVYPLNLDTCLLSMLGSSLSSQKFVCTSGAISRMAYAAGVTNCSGAVRLTEGPWEQGACVVSEGNNVSFQFATCTGGTTTPTVVQVTLTLTVDDAAAITGNAAVQSAMIASFAATMGVDPSQVTLTFQVSRRLDARRLQTTLLAIFTVTTPSAAAAERTRASIEAVALPDTSTAISTAAANAGYAGSLQVTGKSAVAPSETDASPSCAAHKAAWAAMLLLLRFFFV